MKTGKGNRLTVLVPGLAGMSGVIKDAGIDAPASRSLDIILSRAASVVFNHVEDIDIDSLVFRYFSCAADSARLPVAAVRYLGLTGERTDDHLVQVDPVLLQADQDRLLMLHADHLSISDQECTELLQVLNRFYQQDGWRFEGPLADCWYLRTREDLELDVSNLSCVMGHNINDRMPSESAKRRWSVILNEIQMLLHGSDVNQRREDEGRPMINSVWFWGAGRLPRTCETGFDLVISGNPVAKGLARLAGCDLDESVDALSAYIAGNGNEHRNVLCVHDALYHHIMTGDIYSQCETIETLERDCLAPALDALRSGRLDELVLDTGTCCYTLDRHHLRRFWKRVKRVFQ